MLRAFLSFFGFLFSWMTIGLVMVGLGIGATFWMYGRDLPDHAQLARYEPPTISRIYSGQGRIMDEFARERRMFTPIDEIPDLVKHAFISAEDKNFYRHRGYDPLGIIKAVIDAAQGKRLRGASTITQQVMKNFLLDGDRSVERKIKEIILASRLEGTLAKDKILELYLNEIFLGQNSYGVTAAAQTYFNKTLEELTPQEAAYLAVLPKAPSTYHPVRRKDRAIERRNFVLREMAENGYLDSAAEQTAMAADLKTVQSGDFASYKSGLPPRDYFTDEIRRQLSDTFGEDEFFGGGRTIRATVDPELQHMAAAAL
ncbi:MAG: transglycosylase domain-containing protein, partial [Paracoccaceae bacterium]